MPDTIKRQYQQRTMFLKKNLKNINEDHEKKTPQSQINRAGVVICSKALVAQTEKALYKGKLIDFALGSKDNKQQCDKKSGPCPFGVLVCKCD